MGRVNSETIKKLTDFINSLPDEAKGKCSLCNETLVHIVKMAEAQTGAGTATVTRALAEDINKTALPQDVVNPESLRNKVRVVETESIRCKTPNKPEPKKEPFIQDQTIYGLNKKPKQKEVMPEYVDESTEAMQFATIAISQLSRIRKNDPKKIDALDRVINWIKRKKQE